MATMIDSSSVIRLFENNLFDYDSGRNMMLYKENGLNMEFAVPWFSNEVGSKYDLGQVRKVLGEMMRNVAHTEAIRAKMDDDEFMKKLSKEMTDFGMEQLDDTEFFGYEEDRKALCSVELEYLVSLLIINKKETVTSLLDAMREDARNEKNDKEKTNPETV